MGSKPETLLKSFLQNALQRYQVESDVWSFTDFYLQPNSRTGELVLLNDDEEVLSCIVIEEWSSYEGVVFYEVVGRVLSDVLQSMQQDGFFEQLNLIKPYSFVLVDDDKENLIDLLLVDDQETLLLNDGLLSGLDEELDAFLKDLLGK